MKRIIAKAGEAMSWALAGGTAILASVQPDAIAAIEAWVTSAVLAVLAFCFDAWRDMS